MNKPATLGSWFLATAWLLVSTALPLLAWGEAALVTAGGLLWALVVATLVYTSAHLTHLIAIGTPRISAGMVWFFAFIVGGVVPLAQARTGLYPNLVDRDTLVLGQAILLTALVAFDLGQHAAGDRQTGPKPPATSLRIVDIGRLRLASIGALAASAFYVYTLGGLGAFFASRRDLANSFADAGLRDGSQVGSAILLSLGQVPIIIVLVAWVVHYAKNPELRTLGAKLWVVLLIAVNLVVNNPISNARYWFLTVIIGLIYALPRFGPKLFRFALVGGAIAALLAFPYSDYYRVTASERGPLTVGPLAQTLATKDYDQSVMTANGVWFVDTFGHTYGEQLLGPLFFWIPRSIWPGKPIDTGLMIGLELPNPGTPNLSSPLWIEVFIDFGFAGVALAFLGLGYATHQLDQRFAELLSEQPAETYLLQIMLPFLAGYSLIILRGSLLQSMSRLSIILAVCWFIGTRVQVTRDGARTPRTSRRGVDGYR